MPPKKKLPKTISPADGDSLRVRWREWSNLKTNLVWIYEGPVAPENRKGSHSPEHLAAWLLLKGHVSLRQQGKVTKAGPGEWMIPWPGYRRQEFSDDAEILSLRFQADWPDGKPLFERGLSVRFAAARFPSLERAARSLLEAARPNIPNNPVQLPRGPVPFDGFLRVKSALLSWLAELYAALCELGLKPTRLGICDERVIAALQRLDGHSLSRKFSERLLAGELGLSPSQLVRLFQQELGETPKQYFEQRRRTYARQMLTSSSVPIKEIAYSLGFSRLSDFSSWHKKHSGVAPRAHRRDAAHVNPV